MLEFRRLRIRNLAGWIACMILAVTSGYQVHLQGGSIPEILLLSASAWGGGIFFILMMQLSTYERILSRPDPEELEPK